MPAYILLIAAAIWHALALGTIGTRGRIVHTLTAVGLAAGLFTGPAGIAGIVGALTTVLIARHTTRWLGDGGWAVLGQLLRDVAVPWLADTVRLALDAMVHVLSPAPRSAYEAPIPDAQPEVPHEGDTAWVALPHGDRWGLLTPTETPAMWAVETYADWLTTAVETCGGFNAAAKTAADRYAVSRSKFARDLRALRDEAA